MQSLVGLLEFGFLVLRLEGDVVMILDLIDFVGMLFGVSRQLSIAEEA